ncbi:MAG TPA: hypothetical protein VLG67_02045 [Candidatus Saccharimonadales bacterium]|nr:hypothetical protein [Candidatus Saccharimonadales bacterium]
MSSEKHKTSLKKNKKYLILLFLAAFLLSFIFTNYLHKQSTVVVNLSDTGFVSESITVPNGTTVTWKISGKNAHWPASDPHPDHTDYPEGGGCIGSALDACKPLKPGESYSFKFDREGTWGMHDHLFPGHTMQISVGSEITGDFGFLNITLFRLSDFSNKEKIVREMAKKDPEKAWKFINKVYIKNGVEVGNGHMLAHIVGNEAFNKYGFKGVYVCDSSHFGYGCIHGVTEEMLLRKGKDGIKEIESECVKHWLPKEKVAFSGCIHGAGHGLLAWRALDVHKALLDCDMFTRDAYDCYDGVFMEYSRSAVSNSLDQNEIWKICNGLPEKFQMQCAKNQIIFFKKNFNIDYSKFIKICEIAPNRINYENCIVGMGQNAGTESLGRYNDVNKICKLLLDTKSYNTCILNASKSIAFHQFENWQDTTQKLCNTISEDSGKKSCLFAIERIRQD